LLRQVFKLLIEPGQELLVGFVEGGTHLLADVAEFRCFVPII
jgi:hypothetical protein